MIRMLDVVVQSSVILLIGLLLMPLLRSRSAALRHWVLAGALVCSAAIPLVGRLAPAWPAPVDLTFATRALTASGPQVLASIGLTAGARANAASDGTVPIQSASGVPSIARLLMFFWIAGVVLSLVALFVGLLRLSRLSRRARPVISGPWVDSVSRLAAQHDVTRTVSVRLVDHPALLLVWGWRRPTMIVPTRAASWPADRIATVVHHELAHIRRADWLTQLLSEVIRAVYWFNPLVWVACARLRAECEVASDDAVLARGTEGATYASHIVEVARDLNTRNWLPAPAIVRASTLERRIRAMLDSSRDRRPASTSARSAAGALLIATTVVVAGLAAQTFSSVTGTIVDPSQGVLPGVTLALTNEQTQAKYEIKTDRTGRYEFVGLPAGNYVLTAALPGFARFTARVTVSGQPLQQDVVLSIGTVQETITVTDGPTAPPSPPNPERARQLEELKLKRAAAKCAEPPPGGGVRMGGNIRVPIKYRDFKPRYPEALHGTSGLVVLSTRIGLTGSVENIEVVSSTHPAFTDAAVDAVRLWEFDATLLNCERVETEMQVTVNFKAQ
jgi:TonB family protein